MIGREEDLPQGLSPNLVGVERGKAEALAYVEATATAKAMEIVTATVKAWEREVDAG